MARAAFRNVFLAAILAVGVGSTPAIAQMFSTGYEFLKAVKSRDGTEVTQVLDSSNGSVINTRDKVTGETALHIVTQRRDVLWIRFLADRGANPNVADKNGVTPVQIASSLGFVEGLEALVAAGANVDVANSTGETPLISAVLQGDVAMVRLLLANGANPDRNDNSGRSARAYAQLGGSSRLMDEISRSDEDRKEKKTGNSYGPSF